MDECFVLARTAVDATAPNVATTIMEIVCALLLLKLYNGSTRIARSVPTAKIESKRMVDVSGL